MTTDSTEPSPWTRPSFVTAAVVVVVVVILGVVLAVRAMTRGDDDPTPAPTDNTASPTPDAAGEESICGLDGVELSGTVTAAPDAEWAYQETTAYPTSDEFGPGATTDEGVRYCFQHSPRGALFAAANALAQAADPTPTDAWLDYFLADSPNRDELLASVAPTESPTATRITLAGFRVLDYDGQTAHVDLAFNGSASGQTFYFSAVYPLRWEGGDWKFAATSAADLGNVVQIPNLAGYVSWGA